MALTLNGSTGISGIAGSAGTPALQGNNDANTGYFFATDTLGLSTAGTERLRIDSSGRLLQGLTTARANFGNNTSGVEVSRQLEGTSYVTSAMSIIRNSNDGNDGGIILGKTRAGSVGGNTVVQAGDYLGEIMWAGADGTSLLEGARIDAVVESGVGNDDMPTALRFLTNGGSTAPAERLRIDSSGRTLVGHNASLDQNAQIQSFTSSTDTFAGFKYGNNSAPNIIRLGKSRNGSVGGNTIVADDDEIGRLLFSGNDGSQFRDAAYLSAFVDGSPSAGTDMPGRLVFFTSPDGALPSLERLRIASDGKVYIGNQSNAASSAYFHKETDGDYKFNIHSSTSTVANRVITFNIRSNVEAMRIDSSGYVGIRETSPSSYYSKDLVLKCAAAEGGLTIRSNATTDTNYVMFADGTSGNEQYRGYISYHHNSGTSGGEHIQLGVAGNSRVYRFYTDGVALGGETVAANRLDDYETGTWTPTDNSGAGLTFTSVNAWYVKVGDLVTMGARFAYPSTTNTNQNKIGGFPFSPGTDVFSVGGLMVGTVQNPMGNQGSWSGMDQTGRLRTENASIPYNDDLSGQTVYLSFSFKTD